MTPDAAEALAAEALAWIAAQDALIAGFLDASGTDPATLRARVSEPEFLASVLDFLLADEPALIAFCENRGIAPGLPLGARRALPGGDLPNWT